MNETETKKEFLERLNRLRLISKNSYGLGRNI